MNVLYFSLTVTWGWISTKGSSAGANPNLAELLGSTPAVTKTLGFSQNTNSSFHKTTSLLHPTKTCSWTIGRVREMWADSRNNRAQPSPLTHREKSETLPFFPLLVSQKEDMPEWVSKNCNTFKNLNHALSIKINENNLFGSRYQRAEFEALCEYKALSYLASLRHLLLSQHSSYSVLGASFRISCLFWKIRKLGSQRV